MTTAVDLLAVLCSRCVHAAPQAIGNLRCTLFDEELRDEREAEQCMGFEREN